MTTVAIMRLIAPLVVRVVEICEKSVRIVNPAGMALEHAKMNNLVASPILKMTLLVLVLLFLPVCQQSESSFVTIEQGAVARVNGCHVSIDGVNFNPKYPNPFLYFRYVCDVPESALKEKNWWGNKPEPLGMSLSHRGCVRFDKVFYCAKKMEPGKYVTFERSFQVEDRDVAIIEPIQSAQ